MAVDQPFMPMRMGMRLGPVPNEIVFVLVMSIVHMRMFVLSRLMHMLVLVTFGQV